MSENPVRRRKTPYRHKVRNHVRQNRPIRNYERGKGGQPSSNPRRRRVVGGSVNPSGGPYDVTIVYVGSSERFDVDAKDYVGALDSGLGGRAEIEPPRMIRMRRVS